MLLLFSRKVNKGCVTQDYEQFKNNNNLTVQRPELCPLRESLRVGGTMICQMFCVPSQSPDKLFFFSLRRAVVTARMFTAESFIEFHFELGLNKEIQSVLGSRHYKTLNVASCIKTVTLEDHIR